MARKRLFTYVRDYIKDKEDVDGSKTEEIIGYAVFSILQKEDKTVEMTTNYKCRFCQKKVKNSKKFEMKENNKTVRFFHYCTCG